MLGAAWRERRLGLVNAFGIGVGDDKLAHAYVEDMVRYYLGEEPLVPSVRTYDLGRPEVLEEALDRFEELVDQAARGVRRRGRGHLPARRARRRRAGAPRRVSRAGGLHRPGADPALRHATVIDGRLELRHVDLRPFVFLGADGEASVLPGGLTRVAFDEGALVVNSSRTAAPRTPGSSSASPPRRGAPRPRAGCCGSPGRGRTSTSASAGAGPATRGRARGRSGRRGPRPAGA